MQDRRQWIDGKFVIQMCITLGLALGGAWIGSYAGSIQRTAVLETTASSITKELKEFREAMAQQTNELRTSLRSLETTVNSNNTQNVQTISALQTDLRAKDRELDDIKRMYDKKIADLEMKNDWQTSRVDGVRDRLSRIEGEMNVNRKEKRE